MYSLHVGHTHVDRPSLRESWSVIATITFAGRITVRNGIVGSLCALLAGVSGNKRSDDAYCGVREVYCGFEPRVPSRLTLSLGTTVAPRCCVRAWMDSRPTLTAPRTRTALAYNT